jgi:muconolactone delta-isomerase
MEQDLVQYMVEFTLPKELPQDFLDRIPQQRNAVNKMLHEGRVLTYALSLEDSRLWVIFSVRTEAELTELIQRLPLTRYMKANIHELTFYNSAQAFTPAFSVN